VHPPLSTPHPPPTSHHRGKKTRLGTLALAGKIGEQWIDRARSIGKEGGFAGNTLAPGLTFFCPKQFEDDVHFTATCCCLTPWSYQLHPEDKARYVQPFALPHPRPIDKSLLRDNLTCQV
jgi:hypothetical protein